MVDYFDGFYRPGTGLLSPAVFPKEKTPENKRDGPEAEKKEQQGS